MSWALKKEKEAYRRAEKSSSLTRVGRGLLARKFWKPSHHCKDRAGLKMMPNRGNGNSEMEFEPPDPDITYFSQSISSFFSLN